MAIELGTGYVSLTVEAEGIEDEVRKKIGDPVRKESDESTKAAGKSFSGLAVGAVGALGAIGVGALVGDMQGLGVQLDVTRKKAATVFEGATPDVRAWADANNEAMGLTDDKLVGLAASFGDLLKPMGFTSDQAAKMSTETVGLAGALSAWSGGQYSAEEASQILASAMLGETDSLKGLGIAISQADIDARLAAKGQSELTGSALEQAKAVATQELIFEKSADAQKAWADGSFKAAQDANALKATAGELKEQIAGALFPAFKAGVSILTNDVIPAFKATASFVSENRGPFIAIAVVIGGALVAAFVSWAVSAGAAAVATIAAMAPVLAIGVAVAALAAGVIWAYQNVDWFRAAVQAVADFMSGTLWPILQTIGNVIGVVVVTYIRTAISVIQIYIDIWLTVVRTVIDVVGKVISFVSDMVGHITSIPGKVSGALAVVFGPLTSAMSDAYNWVRDRIDDAVSIIRGLPGRVSDAFGGMFDGIKSAFRSAINWVIDGWNSLSFTLPSFDTRIPGIGTVGGFTVSTPNIGRLAAGGIAYGPTAALIGEYSGARHNPEVVAPLDRLESIIESAAGAGRRGDIIVHAPTNADPDAIGWALDYRLRVAGV